jgi:hypothetical protein
VATNSPEEVLITVDGLAEAALLEIWAAVFAFPEAWPLAEFIYGKQCKPSDLVKDGGIWIEMAGTLSDATSRIDARTGRLPTSAWTGADRLAFDAHVSDYVGQLYFDQAAAMVVGTVMVSVGVLLALLVICYFFVATVLAALATLFFGLLVTGVAAPLCVQVQEAAAQFSNESLAGLTEFAETIEGISDTGAALIGTALATDTVVQLATGDLDVLKDLVQATVYTGLDTVTGLVSEKEQDATGEGIVSSNQTLRALSLVYGTGATLAQEETVDAAGDAATDGAWSQGGDAWRV